MAGWANNLSYFESKPATVNLRKSVSNDPRPSLYSRFWHLLRSFRKCTYSIPADLSFNNIEKIEGLDKLTKLKDLTLYNNQITMLENMDELTNLHVFSIGNNNLSQIDNVSSNPKCQYLCVSLERILPIIMSYITANSGII